MPSGGAACCTFRELARVIQEGFLAVDGQSVSSLPNSNVLWGRVGVPCSGKLGETYGSSTFLESDGRSQYFCFRTIDFIFR